MRSHLGAPGRDGAAVGQAGGGEDQGVHRHSVHLIATVGPPLFESVGSPMQQTG